MAIEGPIQELALCDLLQLLDLSNKTGTLHVTDELRSRSAVVYLDRGRITGAVAPEYSSRLGQLLVLAGAATAAQVERALFEQRRRPGRRLGAVLVESGAVSAAVVEEQLRFQIAEIVCGLVRWGEGYFRFEEAPPVDWGPVAVVLSVEPLLMEAMRRADELAALHGGVADAEVVPTFASGSAADSPLELQPLEWEVLAEVDGERSLRVIARSLGRAESDVAKAVVALASVGVVEVGTRTRPPGGASAVPVPAPRPLPDLQWLETAIAEGRLAEAAAPLRELARLHPGDAGVSLLLARLHAASGEPRRAIEVLEAAIARDPLLAPAYLALGMVGARCGELERAGGALSTYLRLSEPEEPDRAQALRAASAIAELCRILQEWEGR